MNEFLFVVDKLFLTNNNNDNRIFKSLPGTVLCSYILSHLTLLRYPEAMENRKEFSQTLPHSE